MARVDKAEGTHVRESRGAGRGAGSGETENQAGTEADLLSPMRECGFYLRVMGCYFAFQTEGLQHGGQVTGNTQC